MKLPFTRFIPHALAFVLIASSPLSVLSTTAYANTLEKANIQLQKEENQLASKENAVETNVPPIENVEALPENSLPRVSPPSEEGLKGAEELTNDEKLEEQESNSPSEEEEITVIPPDEQDEISEPVEVEPTEPVVEEPLKEEEEEDVDNESEKDENIEEKTVDKDEELEKKPNYDLTTFEGRYELAKKKMNDLSDYKKQRELVLNAIDSFRKSQTKENMQLVMDYTTLLPSSPLEDYKGDKVQFSTTTVSLVEFIKDKKEKEELLFYFANRSIAQTEETLTHLDLDIAMKAYELLPNGTKKVSIKEKLDKVYSKVYAEHRDPESGYIDWNDPHIKIGDHPTDENPENWEPGYVPGNEPKEPKPINDGFSEANMSISYSLENAKCYKTTIEYDFNGKLVKKVKDLADESEKQYCYMEIPNANAKNFYENEWNQDLTSNLDGANDLVGEQSGNDTEDASLSSKTIQYSFDKGSISPYFHDTGIRVSKDDTITYEQAKDALYQMTIQAQSKFVEDKNRSLGLLDGYIILLENPNEDIPVKLFISLFQGTSIEVKVEDPNGDKSPTLIDIIEQKEVSHVLLNEKEVKLKAPPIVESSSILFPIDNMATALGGTVSSSTNSTSIDFEGNRITFTDNKSFASINKVETKLTLNTRQNEDGIRMVDLQSILSFFNASIEVTPETNEIVLIKN